MELVNRTLRAVRDPKYSWLAACALWVADAVLCAVIVLKVPYTEIDWQAYMEQVYLVLTGEKDYAKIEGGTGPLVYPAGHVKIFSLLFDWTEGGTNLKAAQYIFIGVYLATLAVVMGICVRARIPPYMFPMLVLSKRLHSIYMLRMFNDCFTTLFAVLGVFVLQEQKRLSALVRSTISTVLFSLAVSVKMSALLYLPGLAVVLLYNLESVKNCVAALAIPFVAPQVLLALPFLEHAPWSYASRAFEFSRAFLFEWTVNWRFVGEDIFLSKVFAAGLLVVHGALILAFLTPKQRWLKPFNDSSLSQFVSNALTTGIDQVRIVNYPMYTAQTIALSNLIGVLCARTLHYQFYCWFYWSVPLLLYTSSMPWYICYLVWAGQEVAWNQFPSSDTSSVTAVVCLALIVVNNWLSEPLVEPQAPDRLKKTQ